ncbi:hypothetical protein Ciccas_008336 [Cichlidogyrus casuarinus]|uniref:FYVE-type domain-containing protein n=1 Tax=Cichlidogyrus casuarinus TaxID=1844966 RepID=A0ABD2Q1Q5_9PLAT
MSNIKYAAELEISGKEESVSQLKANYENELASISSINEDRFGELRNRYLEEKDAWKKEKQYLTNKIKRLQPQDGSTEEPASRNSSIPHSPSGRLLSKVIDRASKFSFSSLTNDESASDSDNSNFKNSEIRLLKDKLYEAHQELQRLKQGSDLVVSHQDWSQLQTELQSYKDKLSSTSNENIADALSSPSQMCIMCQNYEDQLQSHQQKNQTLQAELTAALEETNQYRIAIDDQKMKLEAIEKDLRIKTKDQADQLKSLKDLVDSEQQKNAELVSCLEQYKQKTEKRLGLLVSQHEAACENIRNLESHYKTLLAARNKAAQKLSNEEIDLPENEDDAHLVLLKQREELAALKCAVEHLEERLDYESRAHSEQMSKEREKWQVNEKQLSQGLSEAKNTLTAAQTRVSELTRDASAKEEAVASAKAAEAAVQRLQSQLSSLEEAKKKTDEENHSIRQRMTNLQNDMNNSEEVQKDLVRLSQNLQMQLERLRVEHMEVRWQELDDSQHCYDCRCPFPGGVSGNKRKQHCRHCGKVFCLECTKQRIASGPKKRPVPVCNLCHTLLDKKAVPTFAAQEDEN